MKRQANAYLTVVLALCLALLISFSLALIESVRQNAGRLESECITDIALQSVMAEYHREMMEQYNLFVIDSSYQTPTYGKQNVEERLNYYLERNLDTEDVFLSGFLYRDFLRLSTQGANVTDVSYITDDYGGVFRECAVEAVKANTGLEMLEQVQEWMQTIESDSLESSDVAGKKAGIDAELEAMDGTRIETAKDVWEEVSVDNPTDALEAKRRLGILKLVTEEENLSQVVLPVDGLAGSRMQRAAETGKGVEVSADDAANREQKNDAEKDEKAENCADSLADKFLFREYLLRYMGHYGAEDIRDVLKYQAEYLIAGQESDVENLRKVANRICVIREAANTLYLLGSETRMQEIRMMAGAMCALIPIPGINAVMEAAILLGWAYAESVYDVEMLLAGERIPLTKSDATWHYSLVSALWGNWGEHKAEQEGMSYEDYLRVFLMFAKDDELTMRAMNLVEADMRSTQGNDNFRLDACITALEVKVVLESAYGYEYELDRQKEYN